MKRADLLGKTICQHGNPAPLTCRLCFPPRKRAPLLKQSTSSKLETRFDLIWRSLNGPPLEREFKFHHERKWRADFAHLPSRTLIEIEGGVFGYGRHNRPMGFIADAEKHLAAFQDGWRVLRVVALHITTPVLAMIIHRLTLA